MTPEEKEEYRAKDAALEALEKVAQNGHAKKLEADEQESKFDSYVQRLADVQAIDEPLRRSFAAWKLSSDLGMPVSRLEADLRVLNQRSRPTEQICFELSEFLEAMDDAIQWVIDGFLPKGETVLLAGIPKCGKSLLAYDLAYAVARGELFLGEKAVKGKVLIISVDESPRSTRLRLKQRGFQKTDEVRVMTSFSLNQIALLEAVLASFNPVVVIVDSLKAISRGLDISENSAEFADAIYDLKELFSRYDCSAILVHHESKNRDAEGISRVRGSSAITGACWGVWQLQQARPSVDDEGNLEGDRYLKITGRDVPGQTLKIGLNLENFSWEVKGEATEQKQARNQLEAIIGVLRQHSPKGLELDELAELVGIPKRNLHPVLARGIDRKLIGKRPSEVDPNRFVYFVPPPEGGANNTANKVLTGANNPPANSPANTANTANNTANSPIFETPLVSTLNPYTESDSATANSVSTPRGGEVVSSPTFASDNTANNTANKVLTADPGWMPQPGDRLSYRGRDSLLKRALKGKVLIAKSPGLDPAFWFVDVIGGVSQTVPISDLEFTSKGAA